MSPSGQEDENPLPPKLTSEQVFVFLSIADTSHNKYRLNKEAKIPDVYVRFGWIMYRSCQWASTARQELAGKYILGKEKLQNGLQSEEPLYLK